MPNLFQVKCTLKKSKTVSNAQEKDSALTSEPSSLYLQLNKLVCVYVMWSQICIHTYVHTHLEVWKEVLSFHSHKTRSYTNAKAAEEFIVGLLKQITNTNSYLQVTLVLSVCSVTTVGVDCNQKKKERC